MSEKLIDQIKQPSDLKNLDKKELKVLADELREIIVNTVSKNGGHLSSNLGVKSAIIDRKLPINPTNFLPSDIIITYRALPFEKVDNKIHVAFANPQDKETVEYVKKLIAKEGYETEVYITLYTTIMAHIEKIKNSKQIRMCFSDTVSGPEIKDEDIDNTILEDIKKSLRKK